MLQRSVIADEVTDASSLNQLGDIPDDLAIRGCC
jgi:hypothetical protein